MAMRRPEVVKMKTAGTVTCSAPMYSAIGSSWMSRSQMTLVMSSQGSRVSVTHASTPHSSMIGISS